MLKVDGEVRSSRIWALGAPKLTNGTGLIMANLAIINPQAAYNFFLQPNFDMTLIDGGATLTWYLAMSAMLGGST